MKTILIEPIVDDISNEYICYEGLDFLDNDIHYAGMKPLEELKIIADSMYECVCFNNYGFMKNKFDVHKLVRVEYPDFKLYVKKKLNQSKDKKNFRVKLISNWDTSKGTCDHWNSNSMGNYSWNDIETTWEDTDIDFYVIFNKPNDKDYYDPKRTIIFHMEPWCELDSQRWGVKTWGRWANPDPSEFLQVRTHRKYVNVGLSQLSTTFSEFKTKRIVKNKLMSSICSSKYFDPGHIKRIDFLKYIESQNDDIVKVDIYNTDNVHNFKNYKGPHKSGYKDEGILNYKYYFMAENNQEPNFITEKIWEPLLCESLCFYWGCPNITDYIDPRAFILLDLDDFPKSFKIIRDAILNNEWEKRVDVIRREKQKVLNYYGFFPTLERIIKHEFKFNYNPTDDEILYHKYFSFLIDEPLDNKNIIFIHSCNIGNVEILSKLCNIIITSGLIDKVEFVYINNIGLEINIDIPKFRVNNYSPNINLFEIPTINLINLFSKFNKNTNVLYLHTKGVSYNPLPNQIRDWTDLMLYFLLEKNDVCLELLNEYDTIGVNYLEKPHKHYSGNFWWAKSKYLSTLNEIHSGIKHDAEWWVLSKNPKYYEMHSSKDKVNHYMHEYPRENYI